jgi:hypothetical protein
MQLTPKRREETTSDHPAQQNVVKCGQMWANVGEPPFMRQQAPLPLIFLISLGAFEEFYHCSNRTYITT